jgi:aspartyl-tRNA(Asn)/glutamyl-tRNA(Gln) amidotransferase subunit A
MPSLSKRRFSENNMSEPTDLLFASIADISARVRNGRLSPVELAQHCLDRIEALNPILNAFITVTAPLALDQAGNAGTEIRAGHWRGPLHGLPVAVKDFYDTAGIRTTAGFEHFQNRVPSQDAELVLTLRNAGAVLVGKTNMHKLGMGTTSLESHFGPVVNPWSAGHVAGGSSSGSAAAVAAGLCFATVDTDAIGSGRLPAAICGVVCHKPTLGLLSTEGILAGEKADPAILLLSHPCLMARSAEDIALVLDALTRISRVSATFAHHALQPSPSPRHLGIATNFAATDEVKSAFDSVIANLAAMQIKTVPVKVPFEAASFDVSGVERDRATVNAKLFADVDAIVLPTLAAAAPTVDEARARGPLAVSADNTFFANYFGLPAMTVPSGADKDGLPLGVQFVGPAGGDAQVISLAVAYQRATGWRYVPPQIVHANTRGHA